MGAHQEPTGQVLEGISVMASPIAPVSFTVEVSVVPFGPEHFDGGCAGRGEAMPLMSGMQNHVCAGCKARADCAVTAPMVASS
jgi:hypothetical protein